MSVQLTLGESYLLTQVDVGPVQAVADHRCFSPQLDFVRGTLLYVALRHHFSVDIFMPVEAECDQLRVSRLQTAVFWENVKHLQTQERRTREIFLYFLQTGNVKLESH